MSDVVLSDMILRARYWLLALCALVSACATPPAEDTGVEVWRFPSRALDTDASVRIERPSSQRGQRAVLVLVTGSDEAFDATVLALRDVARPYRPPFIVAGIPAPADKDEATSKLFLDFIEWELVPRLESRLRHSGQRILIGEGVGAESAVAFAVTRPDSMDAHIAVGGLFPEERLRPRPETRSRRVSRTALNPSLSIITTDDAAPIEESLAKIFAIYFPRAPSSPLATARETR